MGRHIVCLSFDFDAWSGMIARGLTTPTPVSRGEFGAVAVDRILSLLAREQVASSWFVPGIVASFYPDHLRAIAGAGHEIGNHGWLHVPPADLSAADEESGLNKSNDLIESITGKRPVGYRSPSWDLSPNSAEILLRGGMSYDSSLMGHDHSPYFVRIGDKISDTGAPVFGEPSKLLEMPISWTLDDFPHFEYLRAGNIFNPGLANTRLVEQNWLDDFEFMRRSEEWGVLIYTFHPFVIGRGHRMLLLERLIRGLAENGAVFCTIEEAAREFRSRTVQA